MQDTAERAAHGTGAAEPFDRIRVEGASKVYPNGTVALSPVDLNIRDREFVSLLGPSGCGKSTLLRVIAGLIDPSEGDVKINGDAQRAFVFQDPTMLPWRNVEKNARLLLELENIPREERERRVSDALELVGLAGFEKSYPRGLSGGMRMRLSLARALALQPELFLMDEPFSALDEITREVMQLELLRIWQERGFTSVFVTHNLFEAVFLSHRVVVMSPRPGRIVKVFDIPFEYPRKEELRADPEFQALCQEISDCLREVS
ncbi:ABC transporter ATP-binding protein [Leucobacter ruminantium]|uniref:ABC transporter ATP-binding protein n=1 Tax=Leucobacter ruminantium TaxID=1289170 RepID=A0A939RWQ7_9MICO|nr:ABC transporter ATP-binding protein [Leucobacter ruminantium]MBO1803918.1 ABC transporter ATP-binding protein [Leucobacter ruminantium]